MTKENLREILYLSILFGIYLFYFQKDLLSGERVYIMDGVLWYPMFHYFVESLWSGFIPTWNPYLHMGEPFFYAWSIIRLFDPITLLTVLFSFFIKPSLLIFYHVNMVIRGLVFTLGLYFLFKHLFQNKYIVYILMPFSLVINTITFADVGGLDPNSWFPWIFLFFLRFLEEKKGRDLILFAYFLGITIGGSMYHWAFPLYYIVIFMISLTYNHANYFKGLFAGNKKGLYASFAILGLLCLPLAELALEKKNIVPVVRTYEARNNESVNSGVLYKALGVNYSLFESRNHDVGLANPSEALAMFLPTGMRSYYFADAFKIIMLIGFFLGKHKYRFNFTTSLLALLILYHGPQAYIGWLFKLLYFTFPPFWLARHFSMFQGIILFSLLFFFGLGLELLISRFREAKVPDAGKFLNKIRNDFNLILTAKKPSPAAVIGILALCMYSLFTVNGYFKLQIAFLGINSILILSVLFIIGYILKQKLSLNLLSPILFTLLFLECFLVLYRTNLSFPIYPAVKQTKQQAFWGEKFNEQAIQQWELVTQRTWGLGKEHSWLCYGPTLLKEFTVFEDLIPTTRSGLPTPIPTLTKRSYVMGLHHFWLNQYYSLYEIAEDNFDTFKTLIGSDLSMFAFYTSVSIMPSEELKNKLFQNNETPILLPLIDPSFEADDSLKDWSLSPHGTSQISEGKPAQPVLDLTNESHDGKQAGRLIRKDENGFLIRSMLKLPKEMIGKLVEVSIMIKSFATEPNSIQFDLQDLISPPVATSYSNSGKWENIKVRKIVNHDSTNLLLTILFKSNSGADELLFDNITAKVITPVIDRETLNNTVSLSEPLPKEFSHLLDSGSALERRGKSNFKTDIISYIPTKVELEVEAKTDGVFVFRDINHPHWRAYVDGKSAQIYEANIGFKALPLHSGKHKILFEFKPYPFLFAFYAYVVTNIVLLIWIGRLLITTVQRLPERTA